MINQRHNNTTPNNNNNATIGEYHLVQERRQQCYIIASEPLSVREEDRRDWIPVPKNHIVVITPQRNLLLYPIQTEQQQ